MNTDDFSKKRQVVEKAARELGLKNFEVKDFNNVFGTSSGHFIIKDLDKVSLNKYFVKFFRDDSSAREIEGSKTLGKYINVPSVIHVNISEGFAIWEYISGKLLIEKVHRSERTKRDFEEILYIEQQKESQIQNLHLNTISSCTADEYLRSPTNDLFYKRINGERFHNYYNDKLIIEGNEGLLTKNIVLNGKNYGVSCLELLNSIGRNLLSLKYSSIFVPTVLDHGDAHNWNIIISEPGKIYFIDQEYYGNIPFNMALSKPYYSDLLGSLFYFYPQLMRNFFEFRRYDDTDKKNVFIDIKTKAPFDLRMKLAEIKVNTRKETLRRFPKTTQIDFLSLNEYILLSHALARDPKLLSKENFILFFAFFPILMEFDPFEPLNLYRYMRPFNK